MMSRLPCLAMAVMPLGVSAWTVPSILVARQEAKPAGAESTAAPPSAQQPRAPRTDRYGDPLPPGAAMRLGTVRYRQDERIERIAYSPDGRFVVTDNGKLGLQVWDARDGRKVRQLGFGWDVLHDFAFAPDGKLLATAGFVFDREQRLVIQGLIFTDFATGRQLTKSEGGRENTVMSLAFAPDGKTLATISDDQLRLWDVASGKSSFTTRFERERLTSIAFSPEAASHVLAVSGRTVHLWNVADHCEERRIGDSQGSRVSCLTFSPDGKTLAMVDGNDATVQLWSVADGRLLRRLTGKNESVGRLCFSPDGKVLAATGQQGHLSLWDLETGKEGEPFPTEGLADGPLAFSPDGRTIATRGGDSALHFWDRTTGTDRLATPEAHLGAVQALRFLDGGQTLISGSDDKTVRIWDLSADAARVGRPRAVLKHGGWVRTLAVSPNQRWLATGTSYPGEDQIFIWHLPTGKLRRTFSAAGQGIHPVGARFADEGDAILVCWSDGTLRSWDATTAQERKVTQPAFAQGPRLQFPGNFARSAIFSPDGRRLAVIENMGGAVRVAELETGKQLFAVPRAHAVAFSPDGATMAAAEMTRYKEVELADGRTRSDFAPDTMVYVLDGRTGRERRKILVEGASLIEAVAFSPDGKTLAVGRGWDNRDIHLYDVGDGREVRRIATPPHSHCTLALAFTPDGKGLVTGMSDTSILIWDLGLNP